jgi:hypothetical protein
MNRRKEIIMVNVKINERPKKPYKVSMKQKLVL